MHLLFSSTMGESVDNLLYSLYYDLKSPQAYTSRQNIYREAKRRMRNIRKKDVDFWFEKQLAPTLHKAVRYRFKRNRTIVKGVGEQFQSDLCDMSNIKKHNDNYTFLLTCVDCFSRYAWVKPVKNKSGPEIARVLEEIFEEKVCKRLQTDMGKEYLNQHVRKLLDKYNIELWTSKNEIKAALVERFNRTMKTRMYKYFTANNTLRYLDILPQLVMGYNSTIHSSIGMAPANVKQTDQIYIRQKLYGTKSKGKLKKYKYQVGDHVRISKAKRVFKKGYLPNWTEEVFIITNRTNRTEPIYHIEDLNGEKIDGTFYEKELQRIQLPKEFRIERVISTKKVGRKTQYLVKWLGWADSFNSWVPEEELKKI
jgi:transposase InsO family protein